MYIRSPLSALFPLSRQPVTRAPQAILLLLWCTLLGACVHAPADPVTDALQGPRLNTPVGPRWFALRFRHAWPAGTAPRWAQDLLLAESVVRPSLEAHEARLFRWRFHRRAARTPSGHQFSFIFLTDAATALRIHEEIRAHPVLMELLDAGRVDRVRFDDTGDSSLDATSDPNWPAHLQKHWPLFIMGASAVWLELVGACGQDVEARGLADRLLHYETCHEKITADWRAWGQHAYLHHLSGIFGYSRMLIRKEIRF